MAVYSRIPIALSSTEKREIDRSIGLLLFGLVPTHMFIFFLCWPLLCNLANSSYSFNICSVWQNRRVVVTKEYVAFSNVGEDIILDKIILEEIENAEDMSQLSRLRIDGTHFENAVVISTKTAGYNGGRAYYLKTDSKDDCAKLAGQLSSLAKYAARNVNARSPLGNLCLTSRSAFDSLYFQYTFALLTLAVSAKPV